MNKPNQNEEKKKDNKIVGKNILILLCLLLILNSNKNKL